MISFLTSDWKIVFTETTRYVSSGLLQLLLIHSLAHKITGSP